MAQPRNYVRLMRVPKRGQRMHMLCLVCALWFSVMAVQAAAGQKVQLGKIEVTGLQRLTTDEVVAATGLQPGQTVDEATLDEAAAGSSRRVYLAK